MQERYAQQSTWYNTLIDSNNKLNAEKDELALKLAEHDLEMLSRLKPKLIEKRINDGTKALFDSFMSITAR